MSAVPSAGELAVYVVYLAAVGGILLGLWKLLARYRAAESSTRFAISLVGIPLLVMGFVVRVEIDMPRAVNVGPAYEQVRVSFGHGWVQGWADEIRFENEGNQERERLHELQIACLAGGRDWYAPGDSYQVAAGFNVLTRRAGPDGECTD